MARRRLSHGGPRTRRSRPHAPRATHRNCRRTASNHATGKLLDEKPPRLDEAKAEWASLRAGVGARAWAGVGDAIGALNDEFARTHAAELDKVSESVERRRRRVTETTPRHRRSWSSTR